MGTLGVVRVIVDDIFSSQYDNTSWCGALDYVLSGFMRCEPWFSAMVTLWCFFYSTTARSKNALFQVESGTPGITAAFFSKCNLRCLILAVIEDGIRLTLGCVGVCVGVGSRKRPY